MRLAINQDNAASPAYVSPWPPYVELPSITGRSTVPMNDPVYNPAAGFLAPASPPRPVYHSGSPSHSNHNQVDIERIRQGVDVRTTVRLQCCHAISPLTSLSDHVAQHSQQDRSGMMIADLFSFNVDNSRLCSSQSLTRPALESMTSCIFVLVGHRRFHHSLG